MANVDDLTGLLARGAVLSRLEDAVGSAAAGGYPLCLLVVDLDFLKSINDQYGHQCGDAALRAVADVMRGALRGDDAAGRYGGDEFVVILPNTALDGGLAVAERLRAAVEAAPLLAGAEAGLRLSLSIGVAEYPLHGTDAVALFAAADRGAYAAKAAGRNRVCPGVPPDAPTAAAPATVTHATRLVGRQEHLRTLRQAAEAACTGRGGLVLVEGDAGIGKTRLVEELAGLARMLGMRVMQARCHEVEGILPYHPFLEALAPLVESTPDDLLRGASGPYAGELARLIPAIRGRLPEAEPLASLPPEEDRQRLQQALCHFLIGLRDCPALLVLDDIQWADEASVRVLNRLAWQIVEARMLIVCTLRTEDHEANHHLQMALAALERQGRLTRLTLHPLSRVEMSTLLRMAMGMRWTQDDLQHRVLEETGGNPLFLLETVRLLIERRVLREEDGQWQSTLERAEGQGSRATLPLAPSVQAVIEARLTRLEGPARDTLIIAAMIGQQFSVDVLAQAISPRGANLDEAEEVLWPSLELLERQRVIQAMATGTAFKFTHPLIRQVAYQSAPAARRRALHRRVARALEAHQAPAGEVAEHYWLGGQAEPALERFMQAAAQATAIHAVQSAIGYVERALAAAQTLTATVAPATRRAELQERLGDLRDIDGEWQGAVAAYEAAVGLTAEGGAPEVAARLWCKIGDLRGRRGELDRALSAFKVAAGPEGGEGLPRPVKAAIVLGRARIAAVQSAHAQAAALAATARDLLAGMPAGGDLGARICDVLGDATHGQGDLPAAAGWFGKGLAEAEAAGMDRWVAHFQHRLARVVWQQGDLQQAERLLRAALGLAERIGDQFIQANCLRTLGVLVSVRGDAIAARGYYQRSFAIAERSGNLEGMAAALHNLGIGAARAGDPAGADALYSRAMALAIEAGDRSAEALLLNSLGRMAIGSGALNHAAGFLDRSLALCEAIGNPSLTGHCRYLLAQVALERGDVGTAERMIGQGRAVVGIDPEDQLHLDLAEARAHLLAGRIQQAIAVLRATMQRCEDLTMVLPSIDCELLLTEAYLQLGDRAARGAAQRALDRARRSGNATQRGQALRLLGLATASWQDAQRLLEESRVIFAGMGAAVEAARTDIAIATHPAQPDAARGQTLLIGARATLAKAGATDPLPGDPAAPYQHRVAG